MNPMPDRLVVAIGGNATHPESIRGTTEEQEIVAAKAARSLLPLLMLDNKLILTHGNGPVVGKILLRQYYAREQVPPMRLDVCVAHSQGGIAHRKPGVGQVGAGVARAPLACFEQGLTALAATLGVRS